jgi:hypothetical protein
MFPGMSLAGEILQRENRLRVRKKWLPGLVSFLKGVDSSRVSGA